MYVSFGKSVDDVTFRLSLRHIFWLKKTTEHNLRNVWGYKYFIPTKFCKRPLSGSVVKADLYQCPLTYTSISAPSVK